MTTAAPRALTIPRGAALYIGALLGPGLLLLPGLADSIAGPAAILAWVGLLAVSGLLAMVFAALALRFPGGGGVVTYTAAGLGPRAGAAAGWCFLFGVVLGAPVVCLVGGNYIASFAGGPSWASTVYAALLLVLVLGLALGGARTTTTIQLVLVAVLIAVVAIGVIGSAPSARAANWTPFAPHGWTAVGRAAAVVMLSFVGWEAIAPLSNRFADPVRQLPRVIAIAFATSSVVYLCLAAAPTAVLGADAAGDAPLAQLLRVALGTPGRAVAAAAAIVLTLGTTNAYLTGAAALAGSLTGADAASPRAARRLYVAIAACGLVVLALHASGAVSTAELVGIPTALFVTVYLGCTASAAMVLRGRARAAAIPSLVAVVVVLAFSGWALAVAGGVAVISGLWTRRGSDDQGDLAGGMAAEHDSVGFGDVSEREGLRDVNVQCACFDETHQFESRGSSDLGTRVGAGTAAEHLDARTVATGERGDRRDAVAVGDQLEAGVDGLVGADQVQGRLHPVRC
jgi:amino acid efflux transporter